MNITTFSDYTLRVLIYLAAHDGEKVTTSTIAKAYDISFHHVAKAAQWLTRQGYIKSDRGRTGGISLNKAAGDINIGTIMRATEQGTPLVDCMRASGGSCRISPACGLTHALAAAQTAFYTSLESYSLADVTHQKTQLSELLTALE